MFLNILDFNLVLMLYCTGRNGNDAAGFNSRLIKLLKFFVFFTQTCNFVLEHLSLMSRWNK